MTIEIPERYETIPSPEPARTPLGGKLLALRSRIFASGAPALGWDEIEEEVVARRGDRRDA